MTDFEERYRALFEGTHVATYEIAPDGRFRDANAATERLTGMSRATLLQRSLADVIAPECLDEARRLLAETLNGARHEFELDILTADRGRRTIRGTTVPLMVDGRVVSVFGTARDVTDERARQERLELQAGLLAAIQQAVVATDRDGTIVFWSRFAEELYGWTEEEAVGEHVMMLVPEEERERAEDVMAGLAGGEAWQGDFTLRRKDGSTFTARLMDAPLRDRGGRITGFAGISVDATGEREREAELRQAQKMSAVGRLAGGIAHDFNNLLTAIQGHVSLLLMDAEEPMKEDLLDVERNVQRGAALTRRLLSFGRGDASEPRVVDVGPVLRDLQSLLGRLLGEHIAIEYEIDDGLQADVAPSELEQIVVNLAVNARDAMPGGGHLRITANRTTFDREQVGAQSRVPPGEYVRLCVADSGEGMDDLTLARIFQPFFSTKGPERGTGLGLANVRGIVDQRDGHCLVSSTPGTGTEFQIYLPLVPPVESGSGPVGSIAKAPTATRMVVENFERNGDGAHGARASGD